MGDGTRIRPHKAGGRDGWKGCTQHRGLRFCSIRVFTAAFQASGDSIHPLGIRLDCSPPRPTHVHARPFRDVHTEQNPSEPYMLASLHKAHGAAHLSALQRARAARARWGQLVSALYHGITPSPSCRRLVSSRPRDKGLGCFVLYNFRFQNPFSEWSPKTQNLSFYFFTWEIHNGSITFLHLDFSPVFRILHKTVWN